MPALPVTILSFSALKNSENIQLNWQTSSEINSHHLILSEVTDGIHFTTAGSSPASGYSSITKNYRFTDKINPAGTIYYRLKMVDNDGNFLYSKIIKIKYR